MNPNVLLIEDNEQNRYLATFLLDIQLPAMGGNAVSRALRSNPTLDNVPIVAVTSYAMVGDRRNALAAGCDGYIEKPINPETFVAEVTGYLRHSAGDN